MADSGASDPMSPFASDFVTIGPSVRRQVQLADSSLVPVLGEGSVIVRGARGTPVTLTSVLYVPDLDRRLLSVAGIYDRGGSVAWGSKVMRVFGGAGGPPLLVCPRRGDMWYLTSPVITASVSDPSTAHCLSCASVAGAESRGDRCRPDWEIWHARLGHVGTSGLSALRSHSLVEGMVLRGPIPKQHECAACLRGKMAQQPFPQSAKRVTAPFDLVGMDLLGKLECASARSQARYMLLMKDIATGFSWCFFLRKKKEAVERIQSFFSHVERQYQTRIKGLRSDRGGEFLSSAFVDWLDQLGVVHQLTVPYTPQQNGIVERANRTLCGRARAMLHAAGLPKRFWEHALRYAVWCTNRVPSRRLKTVGTPYAALHGHRPDVSRARIFGCLAHVYVPAAHRRKLDDRAVLGVFLGMAENTKGYEFWVPESGQFLISRSAVFHEDRFLRDVPRIDPAVTLVPPSDEDLSLESLFPESQVLSKDKARASERLGQPLWSVSSTPTPETAQFESLDMDGVQVSPRLSTPSPGAPPGEGEKDVRVSSPPAGSRTRRVSWSEPLGHVRRFHPESHTLAPREDVSVEPQSPALPSSPASPGRFAVLADLPEEVELPSEEEVACPHEDVPSVEPVSESAPVTESVPETMSESVPESVHSLPTPQPDESESESDAPRSPDETSREGVEGSPGSPSQQSVVVTLQDRRLSRLVAEKPQRRRQPPLHFSPVMKGTQHHIYRRVGTATAFLSSVPPERWKVPKSYQDALRSAEAERWVDAMQAEFDGLIDLDVWDLVERPPDAHVLRCLWVYALKLNPDNTIERFKARLVIDGSQQREGVDYEDTFASTAGRCTVRVFMVMALCKGWLVHQLDVSQAFLYGPIDKDVYMYQPLGFTDGTRRVCKLKRSLYGLKQAPRIWSEHLRGTMLDLGFHVSPMDPSLYLLVKDGVMLAVLDWVDDMLIGCVSLSVIEWFKKELTQRYKIKDLGPAQKYVGMEFHWDRGKESLYIHQAH